MLKIRLQGTTNDIKWFKKILERDKRITVLDISETYITNYILFNKKVWGGLYNRIEKLI